MFVAAIERAAEFTRPIHTIARYFGSTGVYAGAATLFFVNSEGWALTCRHVADQLIAAETLVKRYEAFKAERVATTGRGKRHASKDLERKYGFARNSLVEIRNMFVNCVDGPLNVNLTRHPTLDVALLKFSHFTKLHCSAFPVFARDTRDLKQGMFLCRLGFPFPEFTNFAYDAAADSIGWTQQGNQNAPRFPIDGMLTRYLAGSDGSVVGFELSTPGLRGQSGGPAFDTEGRVWGMQAATNHLDLDFDVDMNVLRNGETRHIKDSAFLHVGQCVHADPLKHFLRDNNVAFQEG
jgi:hypothetical protein